MVAGLQFMTYKRSEWRRYTIRQSGETWGVYKDGWLLRKYPDFFTAREAIEKDIAAQQVSQGK
jgi:hypothetical protein